MPRSSILSGELLSWMLYSKLPIFWVPIGVIRFCAASALATSCPDSPRACNADRLRSICTWRCLPPNGYGMAAPGTVTQRRAQLVDADVGEILLGQAVAGQRDLDDRDRRGAVVEDQRRPSRPAGICFSRVCEIAVTCALAVRMSTFGWKKILMMPKPL